LTRPSGSKATFPEGPLRVAQSAFLKAILAGQREAALGAAQGAIQSGAGLVDIYCDVIADALYTVGTLWEREEICIGEEHLATTIAKYVIDVIYPRQALTPSFRGNMVITGALGEEHQLGANLVADSMEANGWVVRFLGTDLPHATVVSILETNPIDVLCISTTVPTNLPATGELIRCVRTRLGSRSPRIVLGGAALRQVPRFARDIESVRVIHDLRLALAELCP
jgi:methanogenic corrinoid protein MtbC1